jgi:hypothetical protein
MLLLRNPKKGGGHGPIAAVESYDDDCQLYLPAVETLLQTPAFPEVFLGFEPTIENPSPRPRVYCDRHATFRPVPRIKKNKW